MSDPLLLLREATISKKGHTRSGDDIIINGISFPKHLKTAYRSKAGKGDFYELDAIVFYIENQQLSLSEYVRACVASQTSRLEIPDKKPLLAYIKGETAVLPHIDLTALALATTETSTSRSAIDRESDERAAKRSKVDQSLHDSKDPSEWGTDDIRAEERPIHTRASILQNIKKNFTNVLDTYDKVQKTLLGVDSKKKVAELAAAGGALTAVSKPPSAGGIKRTHAGQPVPQITRKGPDATIPIIVVPAAISSLITMYNCSEFLGKGVFVSGEERRRAGLRKESMIILERASYYDKSKNVQYHVIDDIQHLKKQDWERVVGVFASGAKWQFDGWPWATPAAIFEHVCAFHLHWDDEPLNANVKTWRLNTLAISKTKRYADRSIVMDFWQMLTDHAAARNSKKGLHI